MTQKIERLAGHTIICGLVTMGATTSGIEVQDKDTSTIVALRRVDGGS